MWIREKEVGRDRGTVEINRSIAIKIDFFDDLFEFFGCGVLTRSFHHAAEFFDCDVSSLIGILFPL